MSQIPLSQHDLPDVDDDVRRLFGELTSALGDGPRAFTGECQPAADVVESEEQVEVVIDLPGVPPAHVRVAFRHGVLLVVGEKRPAPGAQGHAFHLVEREFGQFARAVPLNGAFDLATARATLRRGELSITIPRIHDRRGRLHHIPVEAAPRR